MYTYAVTAVSFGRRSIFVRTSTAELLQQTIFKYRDAGRYALHGYVVMPEHLHVLMSPLGSNTVERCVQLIKGGFSHAVRGEFSGEIWQSGYHDHRIRDREDFENQLRYIGENPVRRRLMGYAYVHTRFPERMDAMPSWFGA